MHLLLLPLLLLFGSLQAMTLKERFATAEAGDYLVLLQNKNYTFLHVKAWSTDYVVVEELSVPGAVRPEGSWRGWFQEGGRGATAWTLLFIDSRQGTIEGAYSLIQSGWLDTSSLDPFFATLLHLSFAPIPEVERKRVGSRPLHEKTDQRSFWTPRLIVDGVWHKQVPFTAWRAKWPADGSELSRKLLEIYLPEQERSSYPTFFPYWMEIEGKGGGTKIQVVDSGSGVSSPTSIQLINNLSSVFQQGRRSL